MITPPLWHFSKNSSDFVAGPFPKVQKKKRDFAAQICRGYVYILPIIFISILYNIPKFYEVETTTHCQLELDGTVSFRILKKKKQKKQRQSPIASYNQTERWVSFRISKTKQVFRPRGVHLFKT